MTSATARKNFRFACAVQKVNSAAHAKSHAKLYLNFAFTNRPNCC